MTELTQAQQFVIWYERICRDRDYAARYFDMENRVGEDTEMLDWAQDHLNEIWQAFNGDQYEIEWIGVKGDHRTRGESLRDAIRKAMESEHENL